MKNNTNNQVNNNLKEEISTDNKIEDKTSKKKKVKLKILIPIIALLLIGGFVFIDGNKKQEIQMDIVDTNSSISQKIDEFLRENEKTEGVHSIKDDKYTYVLIVSKTSKASEMSVNLYDVYKQWFKINIEYEVEVNENTISKDNPDKIQKMLIRFEENGKINPIVTKRM